MQQKVLLVEKKDGVATLTLNRPGQMNALSLELRWELQAALEEIGVDPEVGVVVLPGAEACSGLDLKEMGSPVKERGAVQPKDPYVARGKQANNGAINGAAITGGFGDITFLRFVDHPKLDLLILMHGLGLIAGWGLGARLSCGGPARAKSFLDR